MPRKPKANARPDAPMVMAQCSRCSKEQPVKASSHARGYNLPRSWREMESGPYAGIWCPDCWSGAFVPRCLTIPVSGPSGATWEELRIALRQCWGWSTAVANWATTELAKADTPRTATVEKLAPSPKPYLYPGIEAIAPGMDSQAKIAVLNTVTRNYAARRYEVLWRRTASFPAYRYPYPYAVDKDGWAPVKDPETGRPAVRVRLAGTAYVLRLAGGFRNRRKIDGWKRLFSGEAIRREIAIESKPVTRSDHRSGISSKTPGGGTTRQGRVMVRISAWFPRQEDRRENGSSPEAPALLKVLEVKTASDAFLSYRLGSTGEYRHIHADHVRRWRNQHAERNRRFAHDLKREKRWTRRQRLQMTERQEKDRVKFANRMNTWLHEISKTIAEYAYRRRADRVLFDMTVRSFGGDAFPWFQLKQLVEQKLHERRISIEIVGYRDGKDNDSDDGPAVPDVRATGRTGQRKKG